MACYRLEGAFGSDKCKPSKKSTKGAKGVISGISIVRATSPPNRRRGDYQFETSHFIGKNKTWVSRMFRRDLLSRTSLTKKRFRGGKTSASEGKSGQIFLFQVNFDNFSRF